MEISFELLLTIFSSFGLGALLSGIGVAWVKDKLEQNAESKRKVRALREQQYKDFLNNPMGFFKGWENKDFQRQFIWDVNANAPVSASDEVYRLAKKYIEGFDKSKKTSEEERQKIYARLVITMRNELNQMVGESKTSLKEDEIKVMKLD